MAAEKSTTDDQALLWVGEEDEELRRSIMPRLGATREENWILLLKGFLETELQETKKYKGQHAERALGWLIQELLDGKIDAQQFFLVRHICEGLKAEPTVVSLVDKYLQPLKTYLSCNELTIEGLQDATSPKD